MCVIDDGETMLVEGLRVAPQERGKGVAGVLLRFCSQLVKSKYPDVKVSRLTRDDQLGPKDFQKYRLITKQVRTIYNKIFTIGSDLKKKQLKPQCLTCYLIQM